ncbi:hypothetical protein Q5P01_005801 [Channa striata]|uniref:Uncharacterized protein n=1 Tax=Channa striata TaxID=64152 RepID=A0AA88T3E5_CHASR|nr:hypothetical protein Q5P01_005801 [Channa striata]
MTLTHVNHSAAGDSPALIVDSLEGRNDRGVNPLAARAGTPDPLNPPCAEQLWANRANAQGLEL